MAPPLGVSEATFEAPAPPPATISELLPAPVFAAAAGAQAALKAAGKKAIVVSVDGGKAGIQNVAAGVIGATSQQYPAKMVSLGTQAIVDLINKGVKPKVTPGLEFFNTGVTLITNDPQKGVPSKNTAFGLKNSWG